LSKIAKRGEKRTTASVNRAHNDGNKKKRRKTRGPLGRLGKREPNRTGCCFPREKGIKRGYGHRRRENQKHGARGQEREATHRQNSQGGGGDEGKGGSKRLRDAEQRPPVREKLSPCERIGQAGDSKEEKIEKKLRGEREERREGPFTSPPNRIVAVVTGELEKSSDRLPRASPWTRPELLNVIGTHHRKNAAKKEESGTAEAVSRSRADEEPFCTHSKER